MLSVSAIGTLILQTYISIPKGKQSLAATCASNQSVDLAACSASGETIVDLHNRFEKKPNAEIAITLDSRRYWDLVLDAVDRLGHKQ